MKRKSWKVGMGLLLTLVLIIAGCSGNNNQNNSNSNGDPAIGGELVTIEFSYWGNDDEIKLKQSIIKSFEDANPDIKIKGTFVDGATYPTKLQAFFTSNKAPDVISIAGDIMTDFITKDLFEDLTPFIEGDGMHTGVWNDKFLDVFRYDGKIVAAPYAYKLPAIVYNKDLFDAKGVAYPTSDWTEDQFTEIAKQLTDVEGKTWGMNFSWWPGNLLKNLYGIPVYELEDQTPHFNDNEAFKHGLSLITGMIKDGSAANAAAQESSGGGFESGRYAMAIAAPWDMNTYQTQVKDKFKWDIVELPTHAEYGPWVAPLFSDGVAMSAKSKNKDAAWTFIKYLTSDPSAQESIQDVAVPALESFIISDAYLNNLPVGWTAYNKKVFVNMLDRSVPFYSTGNFAKLNDELVKQYDLINQGSTTVDEAADALQASAENFLK
jgi:multiple sugar transport system substrate-binding protein